MIDRLKEIRKASGSNFRWSVVPKEYESEIKTWLNLMVQVEYLTAFQAASAGHRNVVAFVQKDRDGLRIVVTLNNSWLAYIDKETKELMLSYPDIIQWVNSLGRKP